MFTTISKCRACSSTDLVEVFNFGKAMPLANDFTAQPDGVRQGFAPLRIIFCRNCTLAQLGEIVDPEILYKNYLYVTSNSKTMERHFDRLLKDLVSENGIGSILEVGSNDGAFLRFAESKKFDWGKLGGIDPAENLGNTDTFPKWTGNFGVDTALKYRAAIGQPDYIIARHCFCHQEWRPFMEACETVSHTNTLIAIEVPYAPDMLKRTEFDTVYHEHTSYLTVKSVVVLLKDFSFHLHAVLPYKIHGGAILLMLRHNDSGFIPHLSADEFIGEENVTENDWKVFGEKSHNKIYKLKELVAILKSENKLISMFGASAKGSVLINSCGFTEKEIAFVTDNSPLKPGRLVPGTSIPVIDEDEMLSHHPDYAICAAWNFRVEVLQKMEKWRKRGGKFIFPTADEWEIV